MNATCPFCSNKTKERLIEEGNVAFVIPSNPSLVNGHLLIIPKRHTQKFSDLNKKEIEEIFMFLVKYQNKILEKLSKGTEVRSNYVPYKENSRTHVNHLHFNLFPRDENDEMSKKVDVHRRVFYKDLSKEDLDKLINLFNS